MRARQWSKLLILPVWLHLANGIAAASNEEDRPYESDAANQQEPLFGLCPDYTSYARHIHKPLSKGPLQLPYQRPHPNCRKFSSPAVEQVIDDLYPRIKDADLAQIFQNAFPNTLDTTVLWHVDGDKTHAPASRLLRDKDKWKGAQSFIVTGDINAEWLRDSTNQLAQYQLLAKSAPDISSLILGAINTQAEFVISSPYCNAFQPPDPSRLPPVHSGQDDIVHPAYEPSVVFECKYELDSLAAFLRLTNEYHSSTGSTAFLTTRWFRALEALLEVLDAQARPTFNADSGWYERNEYTFSRTTRIGTETLNLEGTGNPLAVGTGLIRSAFRPSDDATIFGFLIPANAMMSVELSRAATMLKSASSAASSERQAKELLRLAQDLSQRGKIIRDGIYKHAVVTHPEFGQVFAYEIDGYGSHLLIDDANIPSLLSLPLLGFVDASDEIYQNTRRMILSPRGNPYYLSGAKFSGIGGPHIGLRNAWPMSVLVQAMTSTSDAEILECLERVKNVSVFGLVNESVDVNRGVRKGGGGEGMTRSWFAWANSVFAQTVLWLAEKKPRLLLTEEADGSNTRGYRVGVGWVEYSV
ncbi:meiotically up-regulated protein [Cladophialophora carrionii]|uniref:Meiotically up-regulated protein n=1 Tax=Cladophialophora carrionii TaxID=86049 RepID=A0A1C1C9J3_9EURO|nr:meiotically up-regulated protein [Cladophialophora carrionii]